MTIEIYAFPPSPRAFKGTFVANYLGLDWELKLLNFLAGDHKKPEYLALNPAGRMPTLKDGNFVVWEANAIQQYLAMKKPESGLLPEDPLQRLDVTRWQFWDMAHWDASCAIILFENFVKPKIAKAGAPDPEAVKRGTENFHRAADVLNRQLNGRKYILGDRLTLADIAIGAPLNYAEPAGIPVDGYDEIKRWMQSLRAMPVWQSTLAMGMKHLPSDAAA